jgi:hypothetical protein
MSPRQLKACEVLGGGGSLAESAAAGNVSLRTIKRWRKLPNFEAQIRERAFEGVAAARGVLASGMVRAARSLLGMATGKIHATSPRVTACKAVLELVTEMVELADLRQRIDELDRRRP